MPEAFQNRFWNGNTCCLIGTIAAQRSTAPLRWLKRQGWTQSHFGQPTILISAIRIAIGLEPLIMWGSRIGKAVKWICAQSPPWQPNHPFSYLGTTLYLP